jgi:hypothetical protein
MSPHPDCALAARAGTGRKPGIGTGSAATSGSPAARQPSVPSGYQMTFR